MRHDWLCDWRFRLPLLTRVHYACAVYLTYQQYVHKLHVSPLVHGLMSGESAFRVLNQILIVFVCLMLDVCGRCITNACVQCLCWRHASAGSCSLSGPSPHFTSSLTLTLVTIAAVGRLLA